LAWPCGRPISRSDQIRFAEDRIGRRAFYFNVLYELRKVRLAGACCARCAHTDIKRNQEGTPCRPQSDKLDGYTVRECPRTSMSVQHRRAEQSVPKHPRGIRETSRRRSRARFNSSVDRAAGCGPAPTAATGCHGEPAMWQASSPQSKTVTDAMASEGVNDRSNPVEQVEQNDRTRICGECGAEMKQLGKLPAVSRYPAIRVFRCYGCDNVVSEQM
jgi:hypothetical protein